MNPRRNRDKEQTIEDILGAARKLFSEKGLHGTSLRDLEQASGVSKGLILFHFESKEKLYAKVQDVLSDEYAAALQRFYNPDIPFSEMARETVRAAYRHTRYNDEFRRISLWSYLEGQGRNREMEKKFTENMITVVRQAQEAGLMRADLPADVLPFIVKGAIEYWIQKEELLDELNGQESETEREEKLVETLTRLLIP